MSLENPLGYVLLMLVMLGVSQLVVSTSDFYRNLVIVQGPARFGALDGFRGFLASGVFVHHALVNCCFSSTGVWGKPSGRLYEFLGGGCVLYFFMITGLLFWSKCIRGGARIDAKSLIGSRITRIMPMYWAATVLVFIAFGVESRFQLRVPVSSLLSSGGRWLLGGLAGAPDINGLSPLPINGAVTWTLQYEWVFYLSLPLIASFAKPRSFPILLVLFAGAAGVEVMLGWNISVGLVARFFVGMALAHILVWRPSIPGIDTRLASAVVLCCLVASAALPVPRPIAGALMCFAFAGIVYGNDVFGLLRSRAALFLGHVSYSVYLLHCLVLYAAIKALPKSVALATLTPTQFWIFCVPVAAVVVLLAACSYRFVEHPFLTVRARQHTQSGAQSPAG